MTFSNSKVDIYVKDVDFSVGLILFWYSLWHDIGAIKYISISRSGGKILKLAQRLKLCRSVSKLETDLSSAMPQGGGLWYWIEASLRVLSDSITENLIANETFLDHLPGNIDPRRRVTTLKKLLDGELYWTVTLALMAQQVANLSQAENATVIFEKFSPPPAIINQFIQQINPKAAAKRLPATKNLPIVRLLWFGFQQAKIIPLGWLPSNHQPKVYADPSVAIQFAWGIDTRSRVNDLWWYRKSGMTPSRLVIFFNRKRNPATDARIRELDGNGYRYSILDGHANHTEQKLTNRYEAHRVKWAFRDLAEMFSLFRQLGKADALFWQIGEWAKLMLRLRQWQAFMEAENIKVVFDVVETTVDVAALAADITGAIKIGTHWSDVSYNRTRVFPAHQVYFVWGSLQEEVFADLSPASAFVQIGNIFNDAERMAEFRAKAGEYRQHLEKSGVEFVIGVLDRTYSPSSHVPPPYHVEFYDRLISLAEDDPTLGLLIKPKKTQQPPIFADFPELLARIRKLEERGQATLIAGSGHVCEAGFASDVVVALGINSGGLLCALEDIPTLFWDPTHSKGSPLSHRMRKFGWENELVVYDDFNRLISMIKPPAGDFTEFVDGIDSFRDGQATVRVGQFVRDFMQAIELDKNHQDALQNAVDLYCQQWGTDKVSIRN